jgi:hypothetical protein
VRLLLVLGLVAFVPLVGCGLSSTGELEVTTPSDDAATSPPGSSPSSGLAPPSGGSEDAGYEELSNDAAAPFEEDAGEPASSMTPTQAGATGVTDASAHAAAAASSDAGNDAGKGKGKGK